MATDLEQKIIKQVEYYFGDINLPRDKFLKAKTEEDDGWVTFEVLLSFKRLASISENIGEIVSALKKSESGLLEVSEDDKKIRRNPEKTVPEFNETRKRELSKRTAYAKGFPMEEDLHEILSFLESHGPIESCIKRSYKKDNQHIFKGSCFIIFKDIETCKKFVEAEEILYKDVNLIRKFQEDYYKDKRAEIDETKKSNKEKKNSKQEQLDDKVKKGIEIPKGATLFFSGIEEGTTITREQIKDKLREVADIGNPFIDFNRGDIQGYVRLPKENDAVDFIKKLEDNELQVCEAKLKFKVLEGEEEEAHIKKSAEAISQIRKSQKFNKFGKKRKGGNFGGNNKKRTKVENNDD